MLSLINSIWQKQKCSKYLSCVVSITWETQRSGELSERNSACKVHAPSIYQEVLRWKTLMVPRERKWVKTSPRSHPGGILIRCLSGHMWGLSGWRDTCSALRPRETKEGNTFWLLLHMISFFWSLPTAGDHSWVSKSHPLVYGDSGVYIRTLFVSKITVFSYPNPNSHCSATANPCHIHR